MSNVSTKKTDVEDEITPDDSVSYVSGATHTSTRYVHELQQRAEAARILEEEHKLEMTIADIEDDNHLAEMQEKLETERAARARRRRLRQAEMSMREFQAMHKGMRNKMQCKQETTDEEDETIHGDQTVAECTTDKAQEKMGVSEPDNARMNSEEVTDREWVNKTLQTLNMSPLVKVSKPELSSTLRPIATTKQEIIMKGNLATTTSAPVTTTATQYKVYGDDFAEGIVFGQYQSLYTGRNEQRQVSYQQPAVTFNNPPLSNQQYEMAEAIKQLASSNEMARLPKSEIISFDGSSKNYQRFLASFDVNIGKSTTIDDTTKLTYLIQYCEGQARSLIENCIMMEPTAGLREAKRLLKQEYGRPHDIARSFIDSLTKGPSIATNDHEGLINLAHEMQKCHLTLTQLRYVSDLNSTTTLYAIMSRLPDYLQQKWIEKAAALNKIDKEPDFNNFLQFIQDRSALLKTSFAKESARLKAEKKSLPSNKSNSSDEKKKTPAKTLATSAPMATSNVSQQQNTSSTPEQRKPKCFICDNEHYVNQCEKFKAMSIEERINAVTEKRLCFKCLKIGHSSRFCRNRFGCKECRRNHHTMLHKETTEKPPDKPPDKTNVTAMCAMNNNSVLFPIVAVVVRANGHELKTRAVLDQCSTLSLCTENLLNKLRLKGTSSPLEVDTVNGLRVNSKSVTVNLQIYSLHRDEKFDLQDIRSVPRLPVSVFSMESNQTLNS